jgi:hypothetical protein
MTRASSKTLVAEMAKMRDRVEGLVVIELEKPARLMLQMLADMRDAGIASSAGAPEQLPGEREEPEIAVGRHAVSLPRRTTPCALLRRCGC